MNSLEQLSTALNNYLTMLVIGQPPVQLVTKDYQEWDDIGVTQFSTFISDIFEEVKQITAIRAKNIRDEKGNTNFDGYTITNDEKAWFDLMHFEGAKKIFNVLASMSKTIRAPFLYDDGVLIPIYVSTAAYARDVLVKTEIEGFNIYKCVLAVPENSEIQLDNETYWERQSSLIDTKGRVIYNIVNNKNIPDSGYVAMDYNIKAALKYYVLREWYKIVGVLNEAGIYDEQYTEEVKLIKRNSYLRIESISRKYDAAP
jgi:hypothetical protein